MEVVEVAIKLLEDHAGFERVGHFCPEPPIGTGKYWVWHRPGPWQDLNYFVVHVVDGFVSAEYMKKIREIVAEEIVV